MNIDEFYHREIDALTLEALLPFTKHDDIVHQIIEVTRSRTGAVATMENYFHARCCKDMSGATQRDQQMYRDSLARGGIHVRPLTSLDNEDITSCSLCWQWLRPGWRVRRAF